MEKITYAVAPATKLASHLYYE